MFAHHREALLANIRCPGHLDGLHASLSASSDLWDKFRYTVCLCIPLGFFHEQTCHGNTTAWAQVARSFVTDAEADHSTRSNNVFICARIIGSIVGILVQLSFEGADLVLQLDNVESVDLASFCSVKILANRSRFFARTTAR